MISAITFLDVACIICDVTKQNGRRSVGTLYMEVLGEIVFPMIAFINLNKGEGEAYSI